MALMDYDWFFLTKKNCFNYFCLEKNEMMIYEKIEIKKLTEYRTNK